MPLSLRHGHSTPPTSGAAQVSATLTQGVHGDDRASVWLFWGRQDGGTNRSSWEHAQLLGLNTGFNPATFTATLTSGASCRYRFYTSNTCSEAWAPATGQLATPAPSAATEAS